MSISFSKLSKALEECVSSVIDERISNVKNLITETENQHKLLLQSKDEQYETLKENISDVQHNMKSLTSNELESIDSLQKEVSDISDTIANLEQQTSILKSKLEKVTVLLTRHTELRRSLRGVL